MLFICIFCRKLFSWRHMWYCFAIWILKSLVKMFAFRYTGLALVARDLSAARAC